MINMFEQPWLLLIVAGVVFIGLAIFRDLLPPKRAWIFWLLPVVIASAAFGIDYFFQSDREKIETILDKSCRAVEREDIKSLEPLIWENYSDSVHPSREALLDHFQSRLDEPVIEKIVPAIVSLDIKPSEATAIFTARVMFDPQGPIYEYQKMMLFKLQADLTKDNGEWRFSKVEIITINLQPAGWKYMQGNPGDMY